MITDMSVSGAALAGSLVHVGPAIDEQQDEGVQ